MVKCYTGRDGFSLIELMIAVGIISVLAMSSIYAFQNHRMNAMQSEAMQWLFFIQSKQRQYHLRCNEYSAQLVGHCTHIPAGCTPQTQRCGLNMKTADSQHHWYQASISQANATNYVVIAQPDLKWKHHSPCGDFAIDKSGPVYRIGTRQFADARCWRR
jgi:prepilin-type N-terminal cleavage/methylation domain-containing protein